MLFRRQLTLTRSCVCTCSDHHQRHCRHFTTTTAAVAVRIMGVSTACSVRVAPVRSARRPRSSVRRVCQDDGRERPKTRADLSNTRSTSTSGSYDTTCAPAFVLRIETILAIGISSRGARAPDRGLEDLTRSRSRSSRSSSRYSFRPKNLQRRTWNLYAREHRKKTRAHNSYTRSTRSTSTRRRRSRGLRQHSRFSSLRGAPRASLRPRLQQPSSAAGAALSFARARSLARNLGGGAVRYSHAHSFALVGLA